MLHIPSAVPSSSPALSLFLTSSGSRATRQRHPCQPQDPRHSPATGQAQGLGCQSHQNRLAPATAHSWVSPGHSCFCRALLGRNSRCNSSWKAVINGIEGHCLGAWGLFRVICHLRPPEPCPSVLQLCHVPRNGDSTAGQFPSCPWFWIAPLGWPSRTSASIQAHPPILDPKHISLDHLSSLMPLLKANLLPAHSPLQRQTGTDAGHSLWGHCLHSHPTLVSITTGLTSYPILPQSL